MTSLTAVSDRPAVGRRAGHPTRAVLRNETRLILRDPVGLLWGLVVPLIAFVVISRISALRHPEAGLGGASYLATYQPVIIVFSLTILAINGLPPILGSYRERGVLRRLQATPMPPARLLFVLLTIHLVGAAAVAAVILAVGTIGSGLALPHQLAGWILAYLLTAVAMLGLGVLIAALSPSGKIANGVGGILTFPLLFTAGLWLPLAAMPHALATVSDYSPLGAGVRAMTAATGGHFPPLSALGTLLAYAVVFCALAVRFFRWE